MSTKTRAQERRALRDDWKLERRRLRKSGLSRRQVRKITGPKGAKRAR